MAVPASRTPGVRTKSVYEPPDPSDGKRVLVTQYWPRGVSRAAVDEYIRRLAPSRELLHAFRSGQIDWEAFSTRYLQEMEGEEAKREVRRLGDVSLAGAVTVMCVCKDERICHRSLLRDMILRIRQEGNLTSSR